MPSADLRSMTQWGEGQQTTLAVIRDRTQWRQWHDGDITTIWPQPTLDNGLLLYTPARGEVIERNLLRAASDFYADAVMSEPPTATSTAAPFDGWWRKNAPRVIKGLRRAVQGWSHGGRAVLVAFESGELLPVLPEHYLRVGGIEEGESLVGHILAFPYRAYDPAELRQPAYQTMLPNRILVYRYTEDGEYNTMTEYQYDGATQIGRVVAGPEPAGIAAIMAAGDDDSFYPDVQDVFVALLLRGTDNHAQLMRYSNRPALVPASSLDAIRDQMGPTGSWERFVETKRPVLPLEEVEGQASASAVDVGTAERIRDAMEHEQSLLDSFYILAGIPPTAYGINLGRGESGVARERTTDRARARVDALRRDIALGLPAVLRGIGSPVAAENIEVYWARAPFSDAAEEEQAAVLRYQAGLLTVDEARAALGYPPMAEAPGADTLGEPPGEQGGEEGDNA